MAKADGAVGLNLDIEPRHYAAGAEATRQQRAREKRLSNAELGKSTIIRPEHRLAGADAANRAKKRDKRGRAITPHEDRAKPVPAPFTRSGEAFQMLLAIFGYPTAKLEPAKGKVHRLGLPDEDTDDAHKIPQQQKRRPGYEYRYRMLDGVEQKQCRDCEQWFDLNADHFRYKIDAYKACWSTYCHPCERIRRQAAWRKRYQKMKARVMV
jgi:hypothetical protein